MIRRLNKKGVSPVIATVLLIGMVVVIGLIIFSWLRGITQESVTKFNKNADLVCGDIQFQASYDSSQLSILNVGNVPIYQMTVKVSKQGSFETDYLDSLSSQWPSSGLNQGSGFSDTINFDGAKSITLIPIILGDSGGVEKSFTCDEARFGYEISL